VLFYRRGDAQANVDWPTYGYDISRTGYNPNETMLGVSNVSSLQYIWSFDLGAVTIMQPALASGVMINGSPVDVVYMGSMHGDFYALNADTGSVIWQTNLGSQLTTCGDMPDDVFGVGGTPWLDRTANLLYVVGGDGKAHALNLSTGAEKSGWPVTVTSNPANEFTYGGVNVQNGMLYAEVASYCDYNSYYGRLVEINIATASVAGQWYVTGANKQVVGGGIWGPGTVAIDPTTTHLFTATGNAFATPESYGYADQVVELSSSLSVLGANYPGLTGTDADFGATPALFQLPGCNPMVAAQNKTGVFVVYYRGQVSNGPIQRIQMSDVTDYEFTGNPAWSPVTNMLYIGNSSDSGDGNYTHGMVALQAGPGCTLVPAWQQSVGPNDTNVAPPTVANGVVYYGDGTGNQLFAFNAATGTQLWNSGNTITGPIYASPTVVNGKVYVGSWDHKIYAFAPGATGPSNHVQTVAGATSVSMTNMPGDLLVVEIGFTGTFNSISDNSGDTFIQIGTEQVPNNANKSRLYYARNIVGGANTITPSVTGGTAYDVYVSEYTGLNTVDTYSVNLVNSNSSGSFTSGTLTTSGTNELLWGFCWSSNNYIPDNPSGWTPRSTFDGNQVSDSTAAASGNYSFSGSIPGTENYVAWIVAFTSDTTPPTVPTGLTWTAVSSTQINLSWNPSTDEIGVAGYNIYRNGKKVGTSSTTSYSDTNLTPSTTYSYTVSAYDEAGNESQQSSPPVLATTLSGPTTWTFIQTVAGANSVNMTNTAGDLLVVEVGFTGTFKSLFDSRNTYTQIGTEKVDNNGHKTRVYYAKDIGAGANTVAATVTGTGAKAYDVYVSEYRGVSTVDAYSVNLVNKNSSGSFTSGAIATTGTNELLWGFCWSSNAAIPANPSGWTSRSTFDGNQLSDKMAANPGNFSFSGSIPGTENYAAWIVAFK
jgi:outer membrane protein assembly factor BamB